MEYYSAEGAGALLRSVPPCGTTEGRGKSMWKEDVETGHIRMIVVKEARRRGTILPGMR